jgi:polysaccharide export outer membrane protein
MIVKLMCVLLVAIPLARTRAQSVSPPAFSSSTLNIPPAPPALPISYGDLIEVTVFESPELSASLRVNQAGEVVLILGGAVHVKGLTAAEAGAAIAARLKQAQILLDPHVNVMIVEYQSQGVTVTGEVRTPGVYPILTNRTVMDMIALAGGLNENAGKVASVFHRGDPDHVRQVALDVSVQTPQSVAETGLELEPGDTISVSRSGVIYVVGDVGRPGGFLVEHNDRLSVLQALSLAQGANQTASLGKSELIRKTDSGRLLYKLDLKKILAGSASDLLLADGDILYVPVSYKKVYTLRGIEALIGVGTQAAIYKSGAP